MFNRVLLHGSEIQQPNTTKAAAIKLVTRRLSKIIPEDFVSFSKNGLPVKILKVSNTGRYKIIDTECSSGKIKVLSHSSKDIPSDGAHLTFDRKFTYAYGDSWIIE